MHCRQGCAVDTCARGWLACLHACEAHPHRATAASHGSYKLLFLLLSTVCSRSQLEPRSISQQQARIFAQLEFLQLNHTFDAHLIRHLISLYFTWQNPSLHVVDQDAFERAQDLVIRKGERSTFYTEFLVSAM